MKKYFLFISLLFSLKSFTQTYSFTYQSIVRDYIVHLPAGYNASNKYPLVINMHGYTSTASQQQTYSQMNVVADTGKFIVVYPDGVNNAWNAGFGTNPTIDDVGFLSTMIDTMEKNFSIDSTKIYSCGLSNGGFMSFRLACELQNRIAAIAPVSGLMSDSTRLFCQNNCPVPLIYFHGTADAVVNYNGALGYASVDSTIKIWVGKDGCPQTPVITNIPDINSTDGCTVTKYVYSPGQNSSEVIFFKIINGGHTWPGAFPVPSLGNTNQDIKASGEIWNFFRNHSLQCGVNAVNESVVLNNQVAVYPNPTSRVFNLSMSQFEDLKMKDIEIYNVYGEKIYSAVNFQINQSSNFQIDLNEKPSGIYFLKAETEKGFSVQKIIKQ
ncbi:MAG: T9SS type A sorting domain-containing protein [Bacteroidetes bacterium]|nr:T9SS type A sorting domain-containing protein [Bacteroidota bacterium]